MIVWLYLAFFRFVLRLLVSLGVTQPGASSSRIFFKDERVIVQMDLHPQVYVELCFVSMLSCRPVWSIAAVRNVNMPGPSFRLWADAPTSSSLSSFGVPAHLAFGAICWLFWWLRLRELHVHGIESSVSPLLLAWAANAAGSSNSSTTGTAAASKVPPEDEPGPTISSFFPLLERIVVNDILVVLQSDDVLSTGLTYHALLHLEAVSFDRVQESVSIGTLTLGESSARIVAQQICVYPLSSVSASPAVWKCHVGSHVEIRSADANALGLLLSSLSAISTEYGMLSKVAAYRRVSRSLASAALDAHPPVPGLVRVEMAVVGGFRLDIPSVLSISTQSDLHLLVNVSESAFSVNAAVDCCESFVLGSASFCFEGLGMLYHASTLDLDVLDIPRIRTEFRAASLAVSIPEAATLLRRQDLLREFSLISSISLVGSGVLADLVDQPVEYLRQMYLVRRFAYISNLSSQEAASAEEADSTASVPDDLQELLRLSLVLASAEAETSLECEKLDLDSHTLWHVVLSSSRSLSFSLLPGLRFSLCWSLVEDTWNLVMQASCDDSGNPLHGSRLALSQVHWYDSVPHSSEIKRKYLSIDMVELTTFRKLLGLQFNCVRVSLFSAPNLPVTMEEFHATAEFDCDSICVFQRSPVAVYSRLLLFPTGVLVVASVDTEEFEVLMDISIVLRPFSASLDDNSVADVLALFELGSYFPRSAGSVVQGGAIRPARRHMFLIRSLHILETYMLLSWYSPRRFFGGVAIWPPLLSIYRMKILLPFFLAVTRGQPFGAACACVMEHYVRRFRELSTEYVLSLEVLGDVNHVLRNPDSVSWLRLFSRMAASISVTGCRAMVVLLMYFSLRDLPFPRSLEHAHDLVVEHGFMAMEPNLPSLPRLPTQTPLVLAPGANQAIRLMVRIAVFLRQYLYTRLPGE